MQSGIRKALRFIKIYGPIRTAIKIAGRIRLPVPIWWLLRFRYPVKTGIKIGIIGCGQFSYSAIAYFLSTSTKSKIEWCSDIDKNAASSFADAYGLNKYSTTCDDFLDDTDLVYIASNHATHTEYAIQCIRSGCDIYIEKPISTTWEQFADLEDTVNKSSNRVYVGYNRPHSPSIKLLRENIQDSTLPFSLSCFITGHFIPEEHWYRDPKEGTRVCGNLGHWLDLAVHMLYWSENVPDIIDISVIYSNKTTPSDNFSVVLTSSRGDMISLVFSSRSEPFEGVNESISFQQGNLIAKINDHRHVQLWVGEKYISKRFWPKNVGHKNAILQPFNAKYSREWKELIVSTKLMLIITDMVKNLDSYYQYKINE